jgi:hypothetical protein
MGCFGSSRNRPLKCLPSIHLMARHGRPQNRLPKPLRNSLSFIEEIIAIKAKLEPMKCNQKRMKYEISRDSPNKKGSLKALAGDKSNEVTILPIESFIAL